MPLFTYKAKKGLDQVVDGEIAAGSKNEAVVKIEAMGLVPMRVVEKGAAEPAPARKAAAREETAAPSSVKARSRDVDAFTWQLASLVKANVPILKALSLISQQTENATLKGVVNYLHKSVKDGKPLSEAMRAYPQVFNNLYLSLVRSGEQGGVLAEVLYRVAEHREREQALRRKVQSAMAYPLIMLFVGIGTVFVMLTFFMPKFIGIFERMNQELPVPTQILIHLSQFMSAYWYWLIFAFVFVVLVFGRVKPSSKKKFFLDLIKLHTPIIKQFVRDAEIAKFTRTLGMLLKNGLSVYESLSLATGTLDNDALQQQLKDASQAIISQGATLSSSLDQAKAFPSFAVNMIAVGEEGGKLDESLSEIANSYEKEVNQSISVMTSILEPMLILVIGGVVGFIVFAMLLPIFEIGTMGK